MRTILGQRPAFDRTFADEVEPETGMEYAVAVTVKAVAVITGGIDWAAYWGKPEWDDARVVDYGQKLPEAAARALFWDVEERYRL